MTPTGSHVQAVAWATLLAAFAVFVGLLVGGPRWALGFARTATLDHPAVVEAKSGTVSVASGDEMRAVDAESGRLEVAEGWVIETLPDSRAFVDLGVPEAGLLGPTVNLEPGTSLALRTLRRPRFAAADRPRRIRLEARPSTTGEGGLTAGTAWDDAEIEIETPMGRVALGPESGARITFSHAAVPGQEATAGRMRVLNTRGAVTVTNAAGSVALLPDERTDVAAGGRVAPSRGVSGPENVVRNGRFRVPPEADGWYFERYPAAPTVPGVAGHEIRRGGRSVIHFLREGSEGASADMYFRQELGVDVSLARAITVTAELRIDGQSIPGGGALGTEYPLILRLRTANQAGEQCDWPVGFFAVEPEPGSEYRVDNGVNVPLGAWHRFTSGNVLAADNPMAFANRTPPCDTPVRLLRLEIRASGHDYDSMVDDIAVLIASD